MQESLSMKKKYYNGKEGKGHWKEESAFGWRRNSYKNTESKKYKGFLNLWWQFEIIKCDIMKRKQESNRTLSSVVELKYQWKKKENSESCNPWMSTISTTTATNVELILKIPANHRCPVLILKMRYLKHQQTVNRRVFKMGTGQKMTKPFQN